MWPGFIWNVLDVAFYLEERVCLDEALHLDDSGGSLLDVAGVHLERSRCGLLSGREGLSR